MPRTVFQFGDFELDCASFQLLRKNRAVRIERKPMELLILLVSRKGELVTRSEIAEKLWNREVFVDTEHGINTAIRKLRNLLRDDADLPAFIQTVTGMGYRFIAPVAEVHPIASIEPNAVQGTSRGDRDESVRAETPERTIAQANDAPSSVPRRRLRWIAVATAVFAAAVALLILRLDGTQDPIPRITRTVQLTSDGREKFPMVVTDGLRVYFAEVINKHWALAAVPVSGGESAAIALPFPDAQVLNISPDRSELLIGEGGPIQDNPLWRVPVLAGSPRRLGTLIGHAGAWSRDRKMLAFTRAGDLYVANGDGGEPRKIDLPPTTPNTWAWNPRWSPDGHRVRFERYVMDQHVSAIWEVSVSGENAHLVLPDWQRPPMQCCGEWSPDGSMFIFDAWKSLEGGAPLAPAPDLWVREEKAVFLHSSPAEPVQITAGPTHFFSHAFSPDGKSLYALSTQRREELLLYDPKLHKFSNYAGLGPVHSISFSRDGSIAYTKFPQGELWTRKADGSDALQLTFRPLMAYGPVWSPDGKEVLFWGQEAGQRLTIYTVPSQGGTPRRVLSGSDTNYYDASWSPDGKSILFTSALGPAPPHLEVFNLETQKAYKVPGSDGVSRPRWSQDGKAISAVSVDGRLMLFEVGKNTWSTLLSGVASQVWSTNGSSLYLISAGPKPKLLQFSVSDKQVRELASLSGVQISDTSGYPLFVTPQDQPLIRQQTSMETEIYALFWDTH